MTTFEDKGLYSSVHKLNPDQYVKLVRGFPRTPLVIDNGSYQFRAGWACEQNPRLVYRSLIGRPKTKKGGDFVVVGDEISESDYFNLKTRSPFDNNVVTNFELMEYLLDYSFASLGLSSCNEIKHPVLMTEPIANPNQSRSHMSELLFECYGIPSIMYGIDSVFSLYYNQKGTIANTNALVISSSYENTHVFPVIKGRASLNHCQRISVGGYHAQSLLQSSLLLHYPQHKHQISPFRCEELISRFATMAPESYLGEIDALEQSTKKRKKPQKSKDERNHVPGTVVMQLPYNLVQPKEEDVASVKAAKSEKKIQNQQRLRQLAAERREKKEQIRQENLQACEELKKQRDDGEITQQEFETLVAEGGFDDEADFLAVLKDLRKKVEKSMELKEKKKAKQEVDIEKESKSDSELYPLLAIPDAQLNPDQLKEKRKQRFLKNSAAGRARKKAERDALKQNEQKERDEEEKKRQADPVGWLANIHQCRNRLIERRTKRNRMKAEMRNRRTVSKKRMHLLTSTYKEDENSFGDDSADWQVYRALHDGSTGISINGGEQSDSEEEKRLLSKYEALLQAHDAESLKKEKTEASQVTAEDFQIKFYTDRFRCPEVIYQPSIVGINEAGLDETLSYVLSQLDISLQDTVVQNVFVCGGNTKYPNFVQRLHHELRAIRPFKSKINISYASDPMLDSWRGARQYAATCMEQNDWKNWISVQDYKEKGLDYLKEHNFSNDYIPSLSSSLSIQSSPPPPTSPLTPITPVTPGRGLTPLQISPSLPLSTSTIATSTSTSTITSSIASKQIGVKLTPIDLSKSGPKTVLLSPPPSGTKSVPSSVPASGKVSPRIQPQKQKLQITPGKQTRSTTLASPKTTSPSSSSGSSQLSSGVGKKVGSKLPEKRKLETEKK